MTTSNTPKSARGFCTSRITPALIALSLGAFTISSDASDAGQAAVINKLTPTAIPTLKSGTTITKATATDLLTALALALEDPGPPSLLSTAEIAEGALEAFNGAVRKDKDKIAAQIIATAIATDNLSGDAAASAAVVARVFNVNSTKGNSKFLLTATGKGNVIAAGAKIPANEAAADAMGAQLAAVFNGTPAELEAILTATGKSLGAGAFSASVGLRGISQSLFDELSSDQAKTSATNIAAKIAVSSPAAAGAIVGGFFESLSLLEQEPDDIVTLGKGFRDNPKVSKALGEIIANIAENFPSEQLLMQRLLEGTTKPLTVATLGQLTQGVLRVSDDAADVNAVLDQVLSLPAVKDRASFAGTITVGTGDNAARVAAIAAKLAFGQDVAGKTKILTSMATSLGLRTPDAAGVAADAILITGGFTDDASRTKLGTDTVGKIKSTAAAGAVAAEIVEANIADSANKVTDAAGFAAQIMAKGTKAATDIARKVAGLSPILGNSATFAAAIGNANPKFVQNAAVGVSINEPDISEAITIAAILHRPQGSTTFDKKALGAAAKIGGAVASAVNAEEAADIASVIADNMSVKGQGANKPINLTLAKTLASLLGKAIQSKSGVDTTNRMDEIGEIAAAMAKFVFGKNGTDAKGQKAETKLLTAIGTALIKTLSKKSQNETLLLQADLSEVRDIAGSIAQVIDDLIPNDADPYKISLLGTDTVDGALEKAFAKLAGKKGTADYIAVDQAIKDVRNGLGTTKFENGSVNDPVTDTKNG